MQETNTQIGGKTPTFLVIKRFILKQWNINFLPQNWQQIRR